MTPYEEERIVQALEAKGRPIAAALTRGSWALGYFNLTPALRGKQRDGGTPNKLPPGDR